MFGLYVPNSSLFPFLTLTISPFAPTQTHATPLLLLRDTYEAIALAAFLGLLLAYVEDVSDGEGVVGVMAKVRDGL